VKSVLVLLCWLGAARADTIELPKTKAHLVLGAGWHEVATKGVVAAYKHDRGSLLAVTRADVPNPDAWVADKRQAYVDQLEKGLRAKLAVKRVAKKKLIDANGVPGLDVEARRDNGATVIVRVLLFRTYALSVAIEVPKGGDVGAARAIAKALTPPREPDDD